MTERLDRVESLLTALAERQDRFQQQLEESDHRLRESISEVVGMIGSLAEQQEATDQRIEATRQQQAETDQRFENLLDDARADRQQQERNRALNEQEHLAFRETFQTLLAEISRIWQQLAG